LGEDDRPEEERCGGEEGRERFRICERAVAERIKKDPEHRPARPDRELQHKTGQALQRHRLEMLREYLRGDHHRHHPAQEGRGGGHAQAGHPGRHQPHLPRGHHRRVQRGAGPRLSEGGRDAYRQQVRTDRAHAAWEHPRGDGRGNRVGGLQHHRPSSVWEVPRRPQDPWYLRPCTYGGEGILHQRPKLSSGLY